jgi:hypothetical protein
LGRCIGEAPDRSCSTGEIRDDEVGLPPGIGDRGGDPSAPLGVAPTHDDMSALGGESSGHGDADAIGRTRDQGRTALQSCGHAAPPVLLDSVVQR